MFSFTSFSTNINQTLSRLASIITLVFLYFLQLNASETFEKNLYLNKSGSVWVEAGAITTTITASSNSVCKNATFPIVTVKAEGGTTPYTFVYKINDGTEITRTTTGSNDTINIEVSTSIPDTFKYTLISVTSKDGTPETQTGKEVTVTVNAPPTVDFSFTDNQCSGSSVLFTPTISGAQPFKYEWTFGTEGTANIEKPSKVFNSYGCENATYAIKLVVTDKNGCSTTTTKTLTIKQQPNIDFIDSKNPFDPFSNCSGASAENPTFEITVANNSVSNCISNYSINWGDGNIQNNITFPISHVYSKLGAFNMSITATGNNGCSSSKTYVVKNVSNPSGGLISPGTTADLCAPTEELKFEIAKWGTNSPGTIYSIDYGDGTPIVTYKQEDLEKTIYYNSISPESSQNYPIPHSYKTSSCTNSNRQFTAVLTVTSACNSTQFTANNIIILTRPEANFTVPMKICANSSFTIKNTSTPGYSKNCSQLSNFIWDFGDGKTVTQNFISPTDITHTYTKSGNYTITLTANAFCGSTTKTQQICVDTIISPTFIINKNEGCTPLTVITTNTTNEETACKSPVSYLWEISYTASNCGTTKSYSITTSSGTVSNGTSTLKNPGITFINPGTYKIQLTATNQCGSKTSTVETVIVKAPPIVTINPINPTCEVAGNTIISPKASITNCGTANLTYLWSFPGGTPSSSSSNDPGNVSYSSAGTYKISLRVVNECDTTKTETSFTINPMPVITGNLQACVGKTEKLTGSGTAATLNPWLSSNTSVATINSTGTVTALSAGTTNITYTNSLGCKAFVVFTVYANPSINGTFNVCIGDTRQLTGSGTPATSNPWTSSNSAIATIDNTGLVKGISVGTTTITYTNSTGCQTTSNFIVNDLPKISGNLNGCIGSTVQLVGSGTASTSNPWTSSNITVASVSNSGLVTGKSPGNTIITYTNSNGCRDTAIFKVNESPTVIKPDNQTVCNGNKTLNIVFSGNPSTSTYKWTVDKTGIGINSSGIGNIPAFTAINNGSSIIEATFTVIPSANSCDGNPVQFTITILPSPLITQHPQSATVCLNGTTPNLSVKYTNGTGTPIYQWYSNTVNSIINGTAIPNANTDSYPPPTNVVGTLYYYCKITFNQGGCSEITSNTASVTVNPLPIISKQPLDSQSICVGGTVNAFTVEYTGGVGNATYQWYRNSQNSNTGGTAISGAVNATFTPPVSDFTSAGIVYYYVIVSLNGSGCGSVTSNTAKVVVVPDPVIDLQPLASQTVCQSTTPTTLAVSASGGIGIFSYQWYSNTTNSNIGGTIINQNGNKSTYTPLTNTVGTTYYYCIISQTGVGCQVTSAVAAVTVVPSPVITQQPLSSVVCKGEKPGLLSVTYRDGTGLPQYQWYVNTQNNTTTGVIISGENSKDYQPVSNKVGVLYYYCVVTLPSGGCSSLISETAKVTVNQYPVISDFYIEIGSGKSFVVLPVSTSTDTVPDGTLYTWSISSINPSNSISGAFAQTNSQNQISQTLTNNTKNKATVIYDVKPISGNCVGKNFNITVVINPPIDVVSKVKDITCYGANDGRIKILIEGGNPPYNVKWSGPNNFSSDKYELTDLSPGDYKLSISDDGGIPYLATYTISEPAPLELKTVETKNISCYEANDGRIKIDVSGGAGKYNFNWKKNNEAFSTSKDIINIGPGEYNISVTDTNNCGPVTLSYTITEPQPLKIELASCSHNLCAGDKKGSISVNVSGGTKIEIIPGVFDYYYKWSGPNGFISEKKNIDNLISGDYILEVTDNSGCKTQFSTKVTQPDSIKVKVNTTPISCYGANDATIKIDVTGGISPYNAEWNNYATGFYQENLSANNYIITITDANSCVKKITVTIPEAPLFKISPVVKQITCYGANNGSIKLNVQGGEGKVTVQWNDGSNAGVERNNLGPGIYIATIKDEKPCIITETFIIIEPKELTISAKTKDATDCENTKSGAIILEVSGGNPPYKFLWSNSSTSKDLIDVGPGNFLVTVTDSLGCSVSSQFEIKRQLPLIVSAEVKNEFLCENNSVRALCKAKIIGGVPPYTLHWSSGIVSGENNEFMETRESGSFILQVTDGLGCSNSYMFNTKVPFVGIDYNAFDCNNYIYKFNFITSDNLLNNITYLWDFGDGNTSRLQNPLHTYLNPGNYIVKAMISSSECNTIFTKNVFVDSIPKLTLNKIPKFCKNDSIVLKVSGADTYLWSNGSKTDSIVIKYPGDYYVIGWTEKRCTSQLNFKATYFDDYKYHIYTDKNFVSPEHPDIKFWSDDIAQSKYIWDFGDENSYFGNYINHTYNISGNGFYNVKLNVTNPNGCLETAEKIIWIVKEELPNIFAPGTGNSTVFLKGWDLQVFNSNGILLYEGKDGWDGTYKGKPVASDTYYYVIVQYTEKGAVSKPGYVTVVR